jgi:hypothetical protein
MVHCAMIKRHLLALCCVLWAVTCYAQATATRPSVLGPGLTSNPSVYNFGTQFPVPDQPIYPQIFYKAYTASCTINSTAVGGCGNADGSTNDSGKLLTATAAGVTFHLPAPSAPGTSGYAFQYDGTNSYSVDTPSGTITGGGCPGTPAATLSGLTVSISVTPTGVGGAWMCTPFGAGVAGANGGNNSWTGPNFFNAASLYSSGNVQTGSYTLAATDCGHTVIVNSASPVNVTTLNSLPLNCTVAIVQSGAGQVTVVNGAGATFNSVNSFTKTKAQWAIIGLTVDSNAGGSAAHFVLSGDGA